MVEEEEVEGVVEQLELADGSTMSNLFSISSSRASTNTCKKVACQDPAETSSKQTNNQSNKQLGLKE